MRASDRDTEFIEFVTAQRTLLVRMARLLTAGSIRAGSSTSSAASPAGTIRRSFIGQCARASRAESSF